MRRSPELTLAIFFAMAALLLLVIFHWTFILVHLSQETGTSNGASRAYDFWSGFGSDLSEIALLGGLITMVRHHNCHVKRCWKLGRPVQGTAYIACSKHHPDHDGDKRNVDHSVIASAWESASQSQQ